MSDQCKHGSLRRSCEICERDVEIERLRAENERQRRVLDEISWFDCDCGSSECCPICIARRALEGEEVSDE